MQRWEYKTICLDVRLEMAVKVLNIEGKEGWELVAIHNGYAYLKRPKQPDAVL